jgi:hypothetical protein
MTTFKSEKEILEFALHTDFSKIEKIYQPSEEELKIIIEQTCCTEEEAKNFFHKNKGDLEATIFDYLESNEILSKLEKPQMVSEQDLLNDDISTLAKMDTYRDILYHKDKVFQQKFDETSNFDNRLMSSYDCIAFTPESSEYRKLKFKCSKDYFTMDILRSYLENELSDKELYELSENNKSTKHKKSSNAIELDRKFEVEITHENEEEKKEDTEVVEEKKEDAEDAEVVEEKKEDVEDSEVVQEKKEEAEVKEPERKLVIKTIVKKGIDMGRKWGLNKPVIAFIEYVEKDRKEENINKLASKFMRNCGYFTQEENVYGPSMIIDNWFI